MKKIYFTFMVVLFTSCVKESACSNGGLNIGFNTLNPTENDTIWIRNYVKGNGFTTLISEVEYLFYSNEDSINGIVNGITLELKGNSNNFLSEDMNNPGFLSSSYDYEIQLGTSIYQISKMQVQTKTKKCGGLFSLECPTCYNPVTTFRVSNSEKAITANDVYFLD